MLANKQADVEMDLAPMDFVLYPTREQKQWCLRYLHWSLINAAQPVVQGKTESRSCLPIYFFCFAAADFQ